MKRFSKINSGFCFTQLAFKRFAKHRGFTLIEMMVVLLIIGIIISMAIFSIRGGSSSELEEQTEEFMLRARFVSEQAVLNRNLVALFVAPERAQGSSDLRWCYEWRRLLDQSWQPVTDHMERQCLASGLQIEILVEGEPWEYDPRESPQKPVLIFYPSGEATPFELAIAPAGISGDPEAIQRVQVDLMGRIRWLNREEAEEQTQWQ